MPSALEAAIESIFSAVIQCKTGLIVRTNDVRRAKVMIYRFRKEIGDPELQKLQIRMSPTNPETDIWIIRMNEDQVDD